VVGVVLTVYRESINCACWRLKWLVTATVLQTILEKTRQALYCTYNVTLRRVRATIVVVDRQRVCVCVCVSVVLVARHGKRMRRIVICGPSSSTVIVHIITYAARFSGGGLLWFIACSINYITMVILQA